MNRTSAPLYESLVRHAKSDARSFHVPGHKHGRGLDPEGKPYFSDIMKIDLTEITGLDDLHHPEGVIAEAQRMAAAAFGAEETFFLVNGSTVGNLAAILTICAPGDLLLVQRNVHKSVIHGLMLAGARAVFLAPQMDPDSGIAVCPKPGQISQAWERYPEAKGLFLTNPNYYGMGVSLQPYIELAHRRGRPVIVDEAHGAHYGFHPKLPPSALSCGADLVVQSTHKMLTAMTMASMLHVQGNRVDRDKLRRHLSMLQSSSPSYPLLASLDLARRQLDADGPALFDESLAAIEQFCRAFDSLPGLERVRHQPGRSPYDTLDPYKLTIRDRRGVRSRSGYELQRQLERYGCYAEMADTVHLLLAWSLATSQDDCSRLLQALNRLMDSWDHDGDSRLSGPDQGLKGMETAISPIEWEASMERSVFSEPVQFSMNEIEGKAVPLSEAAGKISAEMVIPYPPGIPLLYPGERIGEHAVEVLSKLAEHNANVQGAADPRLRSIRVRI